MKAVMLLLYWRGLSVPDPVPVPVTGSARRKPIVSVPVPSGSKTGSSDGTGIGADTPLFGVRSMSWSRNWPQTHTRLERSPVWVKTMFEISRAPGSPEPARLCPLSPSKPDGVSRSWAESVDPEPVPPSTGRGASMKVMDVSIVDM